MGEANSAIEPVKKPDGSPYTAAVLIPTINNADELDIVLERLTKQTYPHFDIVISDSKSRETTQKMFVKSMEQYGLMMSQPIVQMLVLLL